jgi:hypothetical protein
VIGFVGEGGTNNNNDASHVHFNNTLLINLIYKLSFLNERILSYNLEERSLHLLPLNEKFCNKIYNKNLKKNFFKITKRRMKKIKNI